MYIIIAGSCDIMIKQPHPKTKEMLYQVVANVSDGNSFGDFALLSDIETICQEDDYDERILKLSKKWKEYVSTEQLE